MAVPVTLKNPSSFKKPKEQKKVTKAKGWMTPYGMMDFSTPVTKEEAYEQARILHEQFADKLKKK